MTVELSATCKARIELLHASMRQPIFDLVRILQELLERHTPGRWRVRVFSTHRHPDEQWKLFMIGRKRMANGNWVVDPKSGQKTRTNATPDKTPHCVVDRAGNPAALAADIWIVDAQTGELAPDDCLVWAYIPTAAYAAAPGFLANGGFWTSIRDWPHVERRGWRDLVDNGVLRTERA